MYNMIWEGIPENIEQYKGKFLYKDQYYHKAFVNHSLRDRSGLGGLF